MTIYAVLPKEQSPHWIGYADSPESACEKARMQAKNPPKPNSILIVIASDDQWVYAVYDVNQLSEKIPELTADGIRRCEIVGKFFVDYI